MKKYVVIRKTKLEHFRQIKKLYKTACNCEYKDKLEEIADLNRVIKELTKEEQFVSSENMRLKDEIGYLKDCISTLEYQVEKLVEELEKYEGGIL